VAGDDHAAKSSTAAHQSDHLFKACGLPVFFPSDVQGILDMGLHALAMSRYAGIWVGMKTIQEVVESAASVEVDPHRMQIRLPEDFRLPDSGVHIRWPDDPLAQEARLMETKWYAALAYVRANRLNRNVHASGNDRFGIIASGKAFRDTLQALRDLGLDASACARIGLRLHQVNVVWPLEAASTRQFASGLQEILVVEEKRQMIEYQLKEELYNWRPDVRPDVLGKFDEPEGDHSGGEWSRPNPSESWLLRARADLTPALIARALARRLLRIGVPEDVAASMRSWLQVLQSREKALEVHTGKSGVESRPPWFCSGCPHNTSTRVPEGSRAVAGIGCHYMAIWMDRSTTTFSQMGGEGVSWIGQAPFTREQHIFANLGDGTWFHSGSLAIRQSVAAGVNITYKILYNDAVAMTGGQQIGERPNGLSVPQVVKSCAAEGVARIVVVSDEPEKYRGVALEANVPVVHRDELDRIQRELREVRGTTVLVYDQTCATEKRRRRKRGKLADPERFVLIHETVCEGCGDCSVQSNCLSIEPLETEFGRKRQVNLSSCNKDESCTKGFCPSFVTVEGRLKSHVSKPARAHQTPAYDTIDPAQDLPEPALPRCDEAFGIVVAGVGGTGVITIGQILGMAAHLEGKAVVTQDAAGLAQKGGSTWSHVQIANHYDALGSAKVDTAKADLVLACDALVAAGTATLALMQPSRTRVALNRHSTPTAGFIAAPDWKYPGDACTAALAAAVGEDCLASVDAHTMALSLLGDSIYANPLLLGHAWQKGWIPLSKEAIQQAIRLNNVQIERNLQAFDWGRRLATSPEPARVVGDFPQRSQAFEVRRLQRTSIDRAEAPIRWIPRTAQEASQERPTLDALISRRVEFLTDYQGSHYAERYRHLVQQVRAVEMERCASEQLTETVVRYLFKLMAYKDEYEVARLLTSPAFEGSVRSRFEKGYTITHHLAPPLLSRRDAQGRLLKSRFGPWVRPAMRLLAKLKFLRGSALDPFGYTRERRDERELVRTYEARVAALLQHLSKGKLELAIRIAAVPEKIRGYGHVKEVNLRQAQAQWQELDAQWSALNLKQNELGEQRQEHDPHARRLHNTSI
jgi:indolepyruvate ferredoxin oxidoreductase